MNIFSLIKRFDQLRGCANYSTMRPTRHSLQRIEAHFQMGLPNELVLFSRARHADRLFASLGPDYDNRNHIIRINSYWRRRRRTRRIPRNLVAFSNDNDDDLMCFDLSNVSEADRKAGLLPVRYWSPDVHEESKLYPSFLAYINSLIKFQEKKY